MGKQITKTDETNYTADDIYEDIIGKGLDFEADFDAEQYTRKCLDVMDPPDDDPEAVVRLVLEMLR